MVNSEITKEIRTLYYRASFVRAEEKIDILLQNRSASKKEKIDTKILRGNIRLDQGRFVEAKRAFERIYNQSKKIDYEQGRKGSHDGLGWINYYFGNYEKARKIFKEVKDFNGLGWVYLDCGDYEKADESFDQGLTVSSTASDQIGMVGNQIGLGWVHYYRGDYRKADEYFHKSLNLENKYRIGYLQGLLGTGFIEYDRARTEEDYEKVEEKFGEIFKKARDWGYVIIRVLSLNGIGWALTGQKKFDKAIQKHRIADEISEIFGYKLGRFLSSIGLMHIYGDPDGPKPCEGFFDEYQKVLDDFKKEFGKSHLNVLRLVGEGWRKWKENKYLESRVLFEKADEISKVQKYTVGRIISLYGKGWSLFKEGEDYERGMASFREALGYIKQIGHSYRVPLIDESYFEFASTVEDFLDLFKNVAESKEKKEKELRFKQGRSDQKNENFLFFLRRWNSFTPILRKGTDANVGGGYFLYWKKKGIVIDPGHNFLENLSNHDLTIADIDVVIVTHLHLDHTDDLLPLLDLSYQYNEYLKREGSEPKVLDFYMNRTTFSMFGDLLGSSEYATPHLLDAKEKERSKIRLHGVEIEVVPTFHKELLGGQEGIGLILGSSEISTDDVNFEVLVPWLKSQLRKKSPPMASLIDLIRNEVKGLKDALEKHNQKSLSEEQTKQIEVNIVKGLNEFERVHGSPLEKIIPAKSLRNYLRCRIGFTGDTGWQSKINGKVVSYQFERYSEVDILVVHIGSLIEEEFDDGYY